MSAYILHYLYVLIVPEMLSFNQHPVSVLNVWAYLYVKNKTEPKRMQRWIRCLICIWNQNYPNINFIVWLSFVLVLDNLIIISLRSDLPEISHWLFEIQFVETYEQLFMNYLMIAIYLYMVYISTYLDQCRVRMSYGYIDHLLRQLTFGQTSLKGISYAQSIRLRRLFYLIRKFYVTPNCIFFRISCHVVLVHSMLKSLSFDHSWLQMIVLVFMFFCCYFTLAWFSLYYALAYNLLIFFCVYFFLRLQNLSKLFDLECHKNLVCHDTNVHRSFSLVKSMNRTLRTFVVCYNELFLVNHVTKAISGAFFMLALGFNLFFYFFVFFAFDRVPSFGVYVAFVSLLISNTLSWICFSNFLGQLVRQQVSLNLRCTCSVHVLSLSSINRSRPIESDNLESHCLLFFVTVQTQM